MDVHPAATIGKGVLLDHGNGLVVGETAAVGDGCSLLHGVTLGGSGKPGGRDRHPKLGRGVAVRASYALNCDTNL
jgi:serine O-acetyltransferase